MVSGTLESLDLEKVQILSGEQRTVKQTQNLILILFDDTHAQRAEERIRALTRHFNRIQERKIPESLTEVLAFFSSGCGFYSEFMSLESLKVSLASKENPPAAVLFNPRYESLRYLFEDRLRYRPYPSGSHEISFLIYASYFELGASFPLAHSEGHGIEWKPKAPRLQMDIFSAAVLTRYGGGGFKIFHYAHHGEWVHKSFLPLQLWLPLYVYPDPLQRSDLYLTAEWGWLTYKNYASYIDFSLNYYLNLPDFKPFFPAKVSLGAVYSFDRERPWAFYAGLSVSLGAFGGF